MTPFMDFGVLLLAGLATPLVALLACFSAAVRERIWMLLPLIPLPALGAALLALWGSAARAEPASILWDPEGLAIGFALDRPGAVLLAVAALLWSAAGLYAGPFLRGSPSRARFALYWLLTLTGSLGVFVVADLVTFYLAYGLVSLAAYGLIADQGTESVRRAGALYLLLAILGEIALLLAFVLLSAARPGEGLAITAAVAALSGSPWEGLTLGLLLLGFALKIALVPLHVWMPPAYTAAPYPAAAVLSGAAVKAGVIGLMRFLPLDSGAPGWGEVLVAAGFFSAFYGVAVGITQRDAKTVLAYSSISQMGLIAAAAGLGLAAAEPVAVAVLTLYAAHHLLAKGALFLGLGVAASTVARRWLTIVPAAAVGLAIAGLPLTGGAAAKIATKPLFDGAGLGLLASLASAGSTLLMLHFLRRLGCAEPAPASGPRVALLLPWWLMALAALVLPWLLLPALGLGPWPVALAAAASPTELWKALWPMLIGAAAAVGLWHWGERLPQVPPGDILVFAAPANRLAAAFGGAAERLDARLRRWPIAGLALLVLTLVFWGGILLPR